MIRSSEIYRRYDAGKCRADLNRLNRTSFISDSLSYDSLCGFNPYYNMDLDKALLSPLSPTMARRSQSFSQAACAIDGLTSALHNFSVRSPPPFKLQCCCGREDCPLFGQWQQLRAKLENDLMLSAGETGNPRLHLMRSLPPSPEIGQGLLHRHEEYVRQHEASIDHTEEIEQQLLEAQDKIKSLKDNNEELLSKVAQLAHERTNLDKRLNQVLLNLEMSDASNKALLKDLDESRIVLTNLSVQNAKSLGFEARLRTVEQERDDMREESRVQGARADGAESKAASLALQCCESDLCERLIYLNSEFRARSTPSD